MDELYDVAKTMKEAEGVGRVALKIKLSGDVIEIAEFIRISRRRCLIFAGRHCYYFE